MKKSNDTIGNRTRELPARSAVPQPNAPPRAPSEAIAMYDNIVANMILSFRYVIVNGIVTVYLGRKCSDYLEP